MKWQVAERVDKPYKSIQKPSFSSVFYFCHFISTSGKRHIPTLRVYADELLRSVNIGGKQIWLWFANINKKLMTLRILAIA